MQTLQQQQGPIDLEIVHELVDLIPDHWRSAVLTIRNTPMAEGKISLKLAVTSPEEHRDYVEPSAALFESVYKLVRLLQDHGHSLHEATYKTEMTPAEDWDFTAAYTYL